MTPTAAISDLVKVLQKQKELEEKFKSDNAKWENTKTKIVKYLLEQSEAVENTPQEITEQLPYLAWKIGEKTDNSLISAHMQIDDVLIPEYEKQNKDVVEQLKSQKEELEKYALALMTERKCSNFSVTGIGRVENRTSIKYNVADKKLFVDDAVKNGYVSELTITVRPNSKFMAGLVEETGELPAGVASFKEQKAVFVKT